MSKHGPRFDVLTTGGKEKQIIAFSSYNLVKVSCCLTASFGILKKYWKMPEEIHFEKNIFAKKIFFAAGDFPDMRSFWKKNFDENLSWIHWTTL